MLVAHLGLVGRTLAGSIAAGIIIASEAGATAGHPEGNSISEQEHALDGVVEHIAVEGVG